VPHVKTKTTSLIGIAISLFIASAVAAQTRQQIEQKYPKVNSYLVRPNILLTARYTSDGQPCEIVLQPLRWTGDTVLLFPLSEEETIRVVEEIVPENQRGKKQGGLFGEMVSVYSGQSFTTPYYYEKMTINFVGNAGKDGSVMVALVTWRDRSCK
jgi:hypothetical protein